MPPLTFEDIQQIKAYRASVSHIENAPIAFHLSTEEINELLAQNGGNTNGIRIYLSKKEQINIEPVTEIKVIATVADSICGSVDYNIPSSIATQIESFNSSRHNYPAVAAVKPCPKDCGSGNGLME